MEVHAHAHTARKKWTHYIWEFIMLFLAVFSGFLAEYQLEHKIEKERAEKFLQSMLLDVRTNISNLDSLIKQDQIIIANHDELVNWLIKDSTTIDRAAFARSMGAIWVRNFLVRKETYEQMRSSGSLRYIGNIEFLKKMMDYERITNHSDPVKIEKLANHHDVLTGNDAAVFRHDMGAALTLRLERLRRSLDAFRDAREACAEMESLIDKQLGRH